MMSLLNSLAVLASKPVSSEELAEWHKSKEYPCSPVTLTLTDNGLEVNDKELISVVDGMEAVVNVAINGVEAVEASEGVEAVEAVAPLGVDALADLKKQVGMIHGWFVNPRIAQTKPFDDIKKKCTEQESRIKAFSPDIQARIDKLNEAEFAAVEAILSSYIAEKVKETGYEPAMSSFDGLLAKKRKTKCITKNDEPNAAVRKEIDALIAEVVAPIKAAEERAAEEKRLKDEENRQHAIFADSLDSKEDIPALEKLVGDLDLMFPAIKDFAETRIKSKISMIECREAKAEQARVDAKALADSVEFKAPPVDESRVADFKESLTGLSAAIASAPSAEGGVTDEEIIKQYLLSILNHTISVKPALAGDAGIAVNWIEKQIHNVRTEALKRINHDF